MELSFHRAVGAAAADRGCSANRRSGSVQAAPSRSSQTAEHRLHPDHLQHRHSQKHEQSEEDSEVKSVGM